MIIVKYMVINEYFSPLPIFEIQLLFEITNVYFQ